MKQQPVQVEAHRTGGGVEKNKQAARKNTLVIQTTTRMEVTVVHL